MKNILAVSLLISILLIVGCQRKCENNSHNADPSPTADPTPTPYPYESISPKITDEDVIKSFITPINGTFEVTSLFCVARTINYEYVLNNNDIVGKELFIIDNEVVYDGVTYICVSVAERNGYEISNLYNLPAGQASIMCGGGIQLNELVMYSVYIKAFGLWNEDNNKGFVLLECFDGSLLLYLGESFRYWSVFELSEVE